MSWCPKCKTEYRDGYRTCSDCGTELVNEVSGLDGESSDDHQAFLVSTPDRIQADLLESLLRAYNIPVLRRHPGSGEYLQIYMGTSNFGTDLYVPSRLLQTAREILESQPVEEEAFE
jgi:hypothetical protein